SADLASLADQQVTQSNHVSVALPRREIHLGEALRIHGIPLHVHISQVASGGLSSHSFCVEHLTKRYLVSRVDWCQLPMLRNRSQTLDAGVLHGDGRVATFRHRARDEGS